MHLNVRGRAPPFGWSIQDSPADHCSAFGLFIAPPVLPERPEYSLCILSAYPSEAQNWFCGLPRIFSLSSSAEPPDVLLCMSKFSLAAASHLNCNSPDYLGPSSDSLIWPRFRIAILCSDRLVSCATSGKQCCPKALDSSYDDLPTPISIFQQPLLLLSLDD